MDWSQASVLVTGGTGSFGHRFVRFLLEEHPPRRLVVFSRDEAKQDQMRRVFPDGPGSLLRFFIGDVRDRDRLYRAFDGIDVVIHTAALKQVPACEYNPIEAVRTNVLGAANVIDAAIDRHVEKVIALSTDKAANPINLYGATKLCSDKLFVAANHYAGGHRTRFSLVRYGNVIGSRGSVVPCFLKMRRSGEVTITDRRMTRFLLTLDQGVRFVWESLERMRGGEIFVPKIPSMNIMELAAAVAPECRTRIIGIRPGEKLHEVMVAEDDAHHTLEHDTYFAILPTFAEWDHESYVSQNGGRPCPEGFRYASDSNTHWMKVEELRELIDFAGLDDQQDV